MLGGVVARRDDRKAGFGGLDGDVMADLTGDEEIGAGGKRAFPFVVRRAAADRDFLDLSRGVTPGPGAGGEGLIGCLL